VLAQGCGIGEERGPAARIHTLWSASSGRPKCRVRATCVHDPRHCERLGGRYGSRSVPSCGSSSRGVRGSPAVCITKGEKNSCRVTTRRRNFWILSDLGRGLGPLAALFLCLGVLGFGVVGLATLSLPLRRLPTVDLSPAFRILAVALVPTPGLILASAPFVQAGSRAGAACSGLGTGLCLNVVVAHGRFDLPRESSGRMCHHSPRALSKREQNDCLPVYGCLKEQDRDQDGIRKAIRKRRSDRDTSLVLVALSTRSQLALIFCAVPPFGDTTLASCLLPATRRGAVGRGVVMPVPEPDMSVETDGPLRFPSAPRVPAPCSWTPVGPNTPGRCDVSTRPPLMSTTEAPARIISGLDSTALGLAAYASQ
jgi:hypothetical protein